MAILGNNWGEMGIETRGRSSGELKTLCPVCSASRAHKGDKCLSVNLDKGVANCHHCRETFAIRRHSSSIVTPLRRKVYTKPSYAPAEKEADPRLLTWFLERGISAETVIAHKCELRRVWMPQTEQEETVITFPYFRNGEVVNVKYRTKGKDFKMEKDAELILYGLDSIREGEPLVIVEGEIDRMTVAALGIPVVSVPNGAGTNLDECFLSCEQELSLPSRFILAGDNDEAGVRLMAEIGRRLGLERCYRVEWPEACKDANDALRSHGRAIVQQHIEKATPVPIEGIFEVVDLLPGILDLYQHGIPEGMHPGWENVRDLYRPRLGETTYITGIPGSGKSAWQAALCVNLAARDGMKFLVYPPESLPLEQYLSQLAELYIGKPFTQGPNPRMSMDELQEAMVWLQEHFILMYPEKRDMATLLDIAGKAIAQRGIHGLILDPWNEIEHKIPTGVKETDYIDEQLRIVRYFARTRRIHIWIVAHPHMLRKDKDGNYPVPTAYDINGSAAWFNKGDNIISVWRDKTREDAAVEIHVQKVRFRYGGKIGMAELYFDKLTGRYSEVRGQWAEAMGDTYGQGFTDESIPRWM